MTLNQDMTQLIAFNVVVEGTLNACYFLIVCLTAFKNSICLQCKKVKCNIISLLKKSLLLQTAGPVPFLTFRIYLLIHVQSLFPNLSWFCGMFNFEHAVALFRFHLAIICLFDEGSVHSVVELYIPMLQARQLVTNQRYTELKSFAYAIT